MALIDPRWASASSPTQVRHLLLRTYGPLIANNRISARLHGNPRTTSCGRVAFELPSQRTGISRQRKPEMSDDVACLQLPEERVNISCGFRNGAIVNLIRALHF